MFWEAKFGRMWYCNLGSLGHLNANAFHLVNQGTEVSAKLVPFPNGGYFPEGIVEGAGNIYGATVMGGKQLEGCGIGSIRNREGTYESEGRASQTLFQVGQFNGISHIGKIMDCGLKLIPKGQVVRTITRKGGEIGFGEMSERGGGLLLEGVWGSIGKYGFKRSPLGAKSPDISPQIVNCGGEWVKQHEVIIQRVIDSPFCSCHVIS